MTCVADYGGEDKAVMTDTEATVDPQRRVAVFNNLRPAVASRMAPAHVKFVAKVSVGNTEPQPIESEVSDPFIVITHETVGETYLFAKSFFSLVPLQAMDRGRKAADSRRSVWRREEQ